MFPLPEMEQVQRKICFMGDNFIQGWSITNHGYRSGSTGCLDDDIIYVSGIAPL